jgi:Cu/Ag efflux protein CusF
LSTLSFSLSDTCTVTLEDKPVATLADLRPGQQIQIHYENSHGVRIAHEILQQDLVYHGHIESIDVASKTVGIKHGMATRKFTLPEHLAVVVKDNKAGAMGDLKIGQTVDVIYESKNSGYLARRIEQKNPTFVGTIRSMDAATRTVKAKNFFEEKHFRLADGCRIVTTDNPNAGLRDLRIGDRVEFVYEDKGGVLIANRIGPESSQAAAVGSETAKADTKVP